jgi:hypothetical protein
VTRPNETANLIYHINQHSECAILEEDVGNFGKAARPRVQPDCRFVHTLEVLDCDQQIPKRIPLTPTGFLKEGDYNAFASLRETSSTQA